MRRTPQRPRIWGSRTCCRAAIVTGCESDSMLALGIDLAAQPSNTGAVFLESAGEPWRAFELEEVPTNDALIGAARRADVLGVDAPFGWPIDFVEAVSAHGAFEGWPGGENRERLTHRETDRAVQERSSLHPLSVSADKLGSTAMRCALLQRRWADEVWDGRRAERDGSDWLVETYPAAALRQWGMQSKGYKNGKGDAPMVRRRP